MTRAELNALADRASTADGADRELDIAIHRWRRPGEVDYMNQQFAKGASELMSHGGEAWEKRKEALYRACYNPPPYTASVDAALMLVPSDRPKWAVTGRNSATVGNKGGEPGALVWVFAATPALAIVAACLRAVAEGME